MCNHRMMLDWYPENHTSFRKAVRLEILTMWFLRVVDGTAVSRLDAQLLVYLCKFIAIR
jgi:hypothetical protein